MKPEIFLNIKPIKYKITNMVFQWCKLISLNCFTADIEKLYAFVYASADGMEKSYGWDLYDTRSEYLRMGVPNQLWTLSSLNNKFEVSTI